VLGGGELGVAPTDAFRQVLNVVVLGAVLAANALAGSGALSGESIGVLANRYPSFFLPAGWVFSIWSLIYVWLAAFMIHQALPSQRHNPVLRRVGWGWVVNGVLNVAWVVTFSFGLFGPALAVMVGLLVNLVWILERTRFGQTEMAVRDRLFVAWPFALYLAWISVALIANTFQYVNYLGWTGFGVPGFLWSAAMMVVATGLAAFMVVHRGNWFFPLVFAWAFVGIADRHRDTATVAGTAYAMTAVALVVLVAGIRYRHRGGRVR
jgi:translocator protein